VKKSKRLQQANACGASKCLWVKFIITAYPNVQDGCDVPIGSGPSESKDNGKDVLQLLKQATVSVGPSKGLAGEHVNQLEDTKAMTALVETEGKSKKNENSEAGPNEQWQ